MEITTLPLCQYSVIYFTHLMSPYNYWHNLFIHTQYCFMNMLIKAHACVMKLSEGGLKKKSITNKFAMAVEHIVCKCCVN